ncbi:hypothetical protein E3W66_08655 [Gammaproteobacteria bacterium LSUCC0057]|uniref:Type II secretion system protein H n=1 Tax=Gammaproteobacteria bacterium LSUCC0057 TaxID=2559237 RepID=A0A4Y8UGK0_9GAMM|nr:hypothetical protein E3W66_08655 [Gammaproteobacteria bacterium LSUCC0057]
MVRLNRHQQGLSLLELLVTLTIAVALLLGVLPSFNQWIDDRRLHSAAGSLLDALRLVRSEAINSGYSAGLIIADDGPVAVEWVTAQSSECTAELRCLRWRSAADIAVARRDLAVDQLHYQATGRPLEDGAEPVCFTLQKVGSDLIAYTVRLRPTGVPVLVVPAVQQTPCA